MLVCATMRRVRGALLLSTDTTSLQLPPAADRYVAWFPAAPLCEGTLEAIIGVDTARAAWPLLVDTLDRAHPAVVELNDDTAHTGTTDSLTVGKAVPYGTYNWFFPLGTTAVGSVRLTPGPRSLALRVPLPARIPYQVSEGERSVTLRLYGVASDINWMPYGGTDPYVTRLSYAQPAADEVTITRELAGPVWGYRTAWSGADLLLEIRRPPVIDRRRPLAGRTIVIDPGHPPVGATGPSGLWEPVATLAVALKTKTLLERAGANGILTRTDSTPVDLFPRTHFAEQHDADVLVSIHANALPDAIGAHRGTVHSDPGARGHARERRGAVAVRAWRGPGRRGLPAGVF